MQLVLHVLGSIIFDFLDDYQLINWIMQPFEWIDIGTLFRMRPLLFDGFIVSEMLRAKRITVQNCLKLKIWTKREVCETEMDEIVKCPNSETIVAFCSEYVTTSTKRKLLQQAILRVGNQLCTHHLITLLQYVENGYETLVELFAMNPSIPYILELFASLKVMETQQIIHIVQKHIQVLPVDVIDYLLHRAGPNCKDFASTFKPHKLSLAQLRVLKNHNSICFDNEREVLANHDVTFDAFVFFWRRDIPVESYFPIKIIDL